MNSLDQAGYVFNFKEHGAFDPNGKIPGDLTQTEIDQHNGRLASAEMERLRETGAGALYLFTAKKDGQSFYNPTHVGTWASTETERISITSFRKSRNNFGAQRLDIWFYLDGRRWHGVNLGDNDIVRVKRTKY